MASKQSVFIRLLVLEEFSYAHRNKIGLTIVAMTANRCNYPTNRNNIPPFRYKHYYFTVLKKKKFVRFILIVF